MEINNHTYPWHDGVRGTQVLPIIDLDDDIIRVEAGPGTGKTFGLVRRVQRILHPHGLNVPGDKVLIVAFNRVIAKQLKKDIEKLLIDSPHNCDPAIQTVHSLCLQIIRSNLRILLPHEQEAMLYDVRTEYPTLRKKYVTHKKMDQALRDHVANHTDDIQLWQAVQRWLTRHQALLISDLPSLLLDKLDGGDYGDKTYSHVIVDEFQDLTPGEQKLFIKLRGDDGKFLALGDPRQSIYKFRGNDKDGLSKIENLISTTGDTVTDIFMTECHRCPEEIVHAANQLMGLYDAQEMTVSSKTKSNIHVVVWKSLEAEINGMAKAIVDNIHKNPQEPEIDHVCHLAMVTRRQFGYLLREKISELDPDLNIDLIFTESLLETWILREAFLFFCLVVDPDAPTWRAWLGYQNSQDGTDFKAPERNSDAYIKFLTSCNDIITEEHIHHLATNPQKPPGKGRNNLYERANRYVDLKSQLQWDGDDPVELLKEIFDSSRWGIDQSSDQNTVLLDMDLLLNKSCDIYSELQENKKYNTVQEILKNIARRLRYQIATRESFIPDETSDLQISTLWGAKGITADHVYLIGLSNEAIPGNRRPEYPGTDLEFEEEQRRLFYVSITRSKKSLILSRAASISRTQALKYGLQFRDGNDYWVSLEMTKFLRDVKDYIPRFQDGDEWVGC